MTARPPPSPGRTPARGTAERVLAAARTGCARLSDRDLVVVTLMAVIPTLFVLALVWFPAIAIGAAVVHQLERHRPAAAGSRASGSTNYVNVATNYPPFWPALAAQPDLARGLLRHRRRRSGCSWPCCWTRRCGSAGFYQTRVLPAGRAAPGPRRLHLAADLLARPGPAQRGARLATTRSTGTATRTTTCGPCWWPPAGGTSATSCCCTWPG